MDWPRGVEQRPGVIDEHSLRAVESDDGRAAFVPLATLHADLALGSHVRQVGLEPTCPGRTAE
jgi:hypothetical protein